MGGYTYIITNQKRGTLYIGVTSDLERRIYEHREGLTPGFAWKYGCTRLVWYEGHPDISAAIQREKSLKRWYRQWKIELIENANRIGATYIMSCGEGIISLPPQTLLHSKIHIASKLPIRA